METQILIGVVMALLGHATHLVKKVVEARQRGGQVGLMGYVRGRPYRTALGVCGTAAAMGWMLEAGQVTAMTAFGVGYMADSALALVRSGTEGRWP